MLLHDWISIEPEIGTGVLSIKDGEVNVGTVKDLGKGYYNEYGAFISITGIEIGDKIFFLQHVTQDVEGVKAYRVRYRDVIEVL